VQDETIGAAATLAEQMRRGERSCRALVERCLERIAEREPAVGAWAWIDAQGARATARARDDTPCEQRTGVLYGVPIGIKDVLDTAEMPTEYGTPIYAGHRPAWDAACVAALKSAGAIILGKTVTTELAALHPARTANPLRTGYSPGGSSAGSAAAVAEGMVPIALGTQTAGSVLRPASYCGVVGYKPTFGTINRAGLKPFSEFTDTIGVLARTVDDAALSVAGMTGRSALQAIGPAPARPRLALCRTPEHAHATADAERALDEAARRLAEAGAEVEACELPPSCHALSTAALTVMRAEGRAAFAHELRVAPEQLSATLRERVLGGPPVDWDAYDAACNTALQARLELQQTLFERYDAVLTFSAPGEAPAELTTTGNPVFNHLWTFLHLLGGAGMPVGVQLVGAHRRDAGLLAIADWAQRVLAGDTGPAT